MFKLVLWVEMWCIHVLCQVSRITYELTVSFISSIVRVPSRAGQQCVRVRGRAVRVGRRRRALRMRGPPRACARWARAARPPAPRTRRTADAGTPPGPLHGLSAPRTTTHIMYYNFEMVWQSNSINWKPRQKFIVMSNKQHGERRHSEFLVIFVNDKILITVGCSSIIYWTTI